MKFAMLSSDTKAYTDAAGKIGIILFFSLGAKEKIVSIVSLSQSTALMEPATRWIYMAADVSALAFIMLVIVTTLFRHRPLQAASGFEPWLSAMAGNVPGRHAGPVTAHREPTAINARGRRDVCRGRGLIGLRSTVAWPLIQYQCSGSEACDIRPLRSGQASFVPGRGVDGAWNSDFGHLPSCDSNRRRSLGLPAAAHDKRGESAGSCVSGLCHLRSWDA